VRQATEKKQEKRFQSASEFRVALDTMPQPKSTNTTLFIVSAAVLGIILGICLALL
jgi:uncharacterized protein involved in exopolysaccharide biosynthesis